MAAMITCTMGAAPIPIVIEPSGPPVLVGGMAAATIMDYVPLKNIATFGKCSAKVPPLPCVPSIAAPWDPGAPTVLINGKPALTKSCTCICEQGGTISITMPGQMTVEVG